MKFKHACFISYRNGKKVNDQPFDDLLNSFARQIYDALESELKAYLDHKNLVFLDFKILEPGSILIPIISDHLSQSLCFIIIYTPNYFSKEKLFCASEFMGISELEEYRLTKLVNFNFTKSLKYIIILRGKEHLPQELKGVINSDFTAFTLGMREIKRHSMFNSKIREIAASIYDLNREIEEKCQDKDLSLRDFEIRDVDNPKDKFEIESYIEKLFNKEPEPYPTM
jgi:hypothetical protein